MFDTAPTVTRSKAALAAKFAQIAAAEPFYRGSLVRKLGRLIAERRYFVSSEDIVDTLLRRLAGEAAAG